MARNYRLALKIEQKNSEARQAEQDQNFDKAIKLYEENIREDYADEFAFERLMIIYRKQKDYEDELRVINRGIWVFEQNMQDHLKHSLGRHVDGQRLEQLSNAIIKTASSKKDGLHFPDPVHKWMRRKEIVEKKLEK